MGASSPSAPRSIQSLRISFSSEEGCGESSGGICGSSSPAIRRHIKEESTLPGVMAGPASPPFSIAAEESSCKFDCASEGLWQPTQYFTSRGRICCAKGFAALGWGSSAWRGTQEQRKTPAIRQCKAKWSIRVSKHGREADCGFKVGCMALIRWVG